METAQERVMIIDERTCNKIVKKNMVLLLMGQLVSLFGSSIYSFAMSMYILTETGSGLNFSLTLALGTLPRVIFGPISGVIADRVDRKKMVVILDILSGVIVLAMFVLSITDELRLIYVYAASFLLATCSTFFNTPLAAAIPNLVDEKRLTRINSLSHSIMSISTIAGPFIGGMVFALIDIETFLLINGLSFVFSGISEIFIDFNAKEKIYGVTENNTSKKEKASFFNDLMDGLRYIFSQKWLVSLGVFILVLNMLTMVGLTISVPYIAVDIWGFSSEQLGTLNMMFPLGMLIGSLVLSALPEAKSNYKRIITCVMVFSFGVLFIGILTSEKLFSLSNIAYLIILMILYVVLAMNSAFFNIPMNVTMQRLVPNEMLGRVGGALGTLSMGLSPFGAIIGGALLDSVDPWLIPFGCGVIMVIMSFIMIRVKELKEI